MRRFLVVAAALTVVWVLGCQQRPAAPQSIVIGAIFHDDVSTTAALRLQGAQLAVDEINDAGIFSRPISLINLSPAVGTAADPTLAAQEAMQLHDQYKAVGVITLYSGLGQAIINVTMDAGYTDFVQCNCSGSAVTLTDPTVPGSDTNGTFYRTVVSDEFQGKLLAKLIEKAGYPHVGMFYQDDPFGTGVRAIVESQLVAYDAGIAVTFDQPLPTGTFDVTSSDAGAINVGNMNTIISTANAGNLNVLVLAVLQQQSPYIVQYLVDHGYKGGFLLVDGAKTNSIFTIATNLPTWLQTDGGPNTMLGTQPNNLGGVNSPEFSAKFLSTYGVAADNYSSTAYDCAYVMGMSLLYSGASAYTAAGVKSGITNFQQSRLSNGAAVVNIGPSELARAGQIIGGGAQVAYEGASGRIVFTDAGDRPGEGMQTYGPNAAVNAFEVKDSYDSNLLLPDGG